MSVARPVLPQAGQLLTEPTRFSWLKQGRASRIREVLPFVLPGLSSHKLTSDYDFKRRENAGGATCRSFAVHQAECSGTFINTERVVIAE